MGILGPSELPASAQRRVQKLADKYHETGSREVRKELIAAAWSITKDYGFSRRDAIDLLESS